MLQHGRTCEDVHGVEKASMSQIVVKFYGIWVPWATLGHFGPLRAASETIFIRFWATLERLLATAKPLGRPRQKLVSQLGAIFGHCEATLSRSGAIWVGFGAIYGPF